MVQEVGVGIGVEGCQAEEGYEQDKHDRPENEHGGQSPFLKRVLAPEAEPESAVQREHGQEEDATGQAVEIEERKQVAVEDALGINRDALEKIGESHAQKDSGGQVDDEMDGIPESAPGRMVNLVAEFKGNRTQDKREEKNDKGKVQRGKHDRIGFGKSGECHTAGGDEPNLVAIPEGAGRIVDNAALALVLGDEGQERAEPQVESVKNEVDGPEQAPENEPYGCQHSYASSAGPLRAFLTSRMISSSPSSE